MSAMDECVDEDDIFEDFTNATNWEQFISQLEEILSEFGAKPVTPDQVLNNGWMVCTEKMLFKDLPLKCSYYRLHHNKESSDGAMSDSTRNAEDELPKYLCWDTCDFPPKFFAHVVGEYFNVYEFVVLSPCGLEHLTSESKLKAILSSACMAISNCGCSFPVFVQYHHWSQLYFTGIAETTNVRTHFPMVMLQPNKSLPRHLSGILDIFKSKVGSFTSNPISLTIHFFYKMSRWPECVNCDSFPAEVFDILQNKKSNATNQSINDYKEILTFGSVDDPFSNLQLVSAWPSLTEDVVVDSESYSDLEPENAQDWYFCMSSDVNAEFRLSEFIEEFWKLHSDKRLPTDVLGKSLSPSSDNVNVVGALNKIVNKSVIPDIPKGGLNRILRSAKRQVLYDSNSYEDLPPLSKEQMDILIEYLFPDAQTKSVFTYPSSLKNVSKEKLLNEDFNAMMESLEMMKSAPIDSLVWRISCLISYLSIYVSVSAMAYLWAEVLLELRYRVDNSISICGLEPGPPDTNACLLYQKLQMLNCCITTRNNRDTSQQDVSCDNEGFESAQEDSEDDEFYDCEEDVSCSKDGFKSKKPCGRLRKNGQMRLLKTGEAMYIPVTQDTTPLTEDLIEEQSRQLMDLGNDAEASEMRAKILSASLVSDMQAFKAANPDAILEDFVRWYSPRDWIEDSQNDGQENVGELSARMKAPGNLWQETWHTTNPVPVRRQKRLFDDAKEAQKILEWLSTRKIGELSQLLYSCVAHASAMKVIQEGNDLDVKINIPESLTQVATQLSRSALPSCDNPLVNEDSLVLRAAFYKSVLQSEKLITQVKSFKLKFPFADVGLLNEEVAKGVRKGTELFSQFMKVEGGRHSQLGKTITSFFANEMIQNMGPDSDGYPKKGRKFGTPFKKVFVLKYFPNASGDKTSSLPQRMSCLLKDDRFLLAGTFSKKTNF